MPRFDGLLFDKDGTLFDFHATWGAWTHGFIDDLAADADQAARLAEAMGYDLENRSYRRDSVFIAGSVQVWADHIHPVLGDWDRTALLDHIISTTAIAPQIHVAPLVPLLSGLRDQGYRLGVATNDGIAPVTQQLRDNAIERHFEFIAGYDSGHGAKPGPGMLLAFAEAIGSPPERIAMIGDSTHDLEAAKAAGMTRIAVLTGMAGEDELAPHADVVLPSIADLPEWLDTANATP